MPRHTVKVEDNLQESVLPFRPLGPEDQTHLPTNNLSGLSKAILQVIFKSFFFSRKAAKLNNNNSRFNLSF